MRPGNWRSSLRRSIRYTCKTESWLSPIWVTFDESYSGGDKISSREIQLFWIIREFKILICWYSFWGRYSLLNCIFLNVLYDLFYYILFNVSYSSIYNWLNWSCQNNIASINSLKLTFSIYFLACINNLDLIWIWIDEYFLWCIKQYYPDCHLF